MATIIASREMEVMEGLLSLLNHIDRDGLWPRTISTRSTNGAQKLVNNFNEAMAWYKIANFMDCRMSAYPRYTDYYINRTGIAPTVLLVDIDKEHFMTIEEFESVAAKTYNNFQTILGSRPMQLWTGGGYHFITPQKVGVFEKSDIFSKFDQPSRTFLQFEERRLTDNKCDQAHCSTISFNNMLLRVPGSINSKVVKFDEKGWIIDIPYDATVRIIKSWDCNMPIVNKNLLLQYHSYLQFSTIKNILEQKARDQNRKCYGRTIELIGIHNYGYIDKLYDKPIDDYRGFCIWRIFVPYFINTKKLSELETTTKINNWLARCNSVRRLSFRPESKIKYAIKRVGTYPPPRQDNLEQINKQFYEKLKVEGIIIDRVTNHVV